MNVKLTETVNIKKILCKSIKRKSIKNHKNLNKFSLFFVVLNVKLTEILKLTEGCYVNLHN